MSIGINTNALNPSSVKPATTKDIYKIFEYPVKLFTFNKNSSAKITITLKNTPIRKNFDDAIIDSFEYFFVEYIHTIPINIGKIDKKIK
ncbi:hypothetical protein GCM10008921_10410 [Metaclostridioides mangenotii]